jgi:cephalosporin hydroxylase
MLSIYRDFHCQHRSDDWPDMAAIIAPHEPQIVVELGTDRGGFAGWLADLVAPWDGQVFTFDIDAKFDPALLETFANLTFERADVLARPHPLVVDLVTQDHVLLYCDNGNKQREVELYAPLLRKGSLLGVHDYNSEILGEWVEPFVARLGFVPAGHERMEALRNEWYPEPMSRFWVRQEVC